MRSSTKWFLAILLGISVGIAAFFIWYRTQSMSVEGFYVETDGFTDSRGDEIASVHFVKVEAYDSLKILRVAEEITRTTIDRIHSTHQRSAGSYSISMWEAIQRHSRPK
ncbi:MAG: hypothetical protein IPF59_00255 [Ignavibacteria bacterium]|nr:hypothetical protein [Ignavibacteria bacterium]